MNRTELGNRLLHNWRAKLVCVVAACFIYFFHAFSLFTTKSFVVNLDIISDGIMIPSENMESRNKVVITVRGTPDQLQNVSEKSVRAYIDLTSATESGQQQFPVFMDVADDVLMMDGLEVVAKPEKVKLSLEEKVFRYITIVPSLEGNPAHGYDITNTTVNPTVVKVFGPKSMVQSLPNIETEPIQIDGISGDFSTETKLHNFNPLIHMEDSDFKAKVSLSVSESGMSREFSLVRVTYRNIPEGIDVELPTLSTNIILEGQTLQLERVLESQVSAWVDCSQISEPGTYTLPVKVSAPYFTRISGQSLESVTVKAVLGTSNEKVELEDLPEVEPADMMNEGEPLLSDEKNLADQQD